jgi:hypothetical protein
VDTHAHAEWTPCPLGVVHSADAASYTHAHAEWTPSRRVNGLACLAATTGGQRLVQHSLGGLDV